MSTVVRYRGPTPVRNPEHDKVAAEYTLRVCEDKPIRVITKTSDIRPLPASTRVLPFPLSTRKTSRALDDRVYLHLKTRAVSLSTSTIARDLTLKARTVLSACQRLYCHGFINKVPATDQAPQLWTI